MDDWVDGSIQAFAVQAIVAGDVKDQKHIVPGGGGGSVAASVAAVATAAGSIPPLRSLGNFPLFVNDEKMKRLLPVSNLPRATGEPHITACRWNRRCATLSATCHVTMFRG
jgi:hypothetical protein